MSTLTVAALVIGGVVVAGLLSLILSWWLRGRRPHRGRHPFDGF